MQGLTSEEYSRFLKTLATVKGGNYLRGMRHQSAGLPPVAGTAGGLATGAASEVPADPNARMIAADQCGASADQASLQPCTAVGTARGRHTHNLLIDASDRWRFNWGAQ